MSKQHAPQGKKYVKMTSALSKSTEDEVRALAYQIYESTGRQDHHAERDWLQAEQELHTRKN